MRRLLVLSAFVAFSTYPMSVCLPGAALHSTPMTAPSGHHNSGYNAGYNNGGYNQQYAPPAGAPPQYGNTGHNNDYYGQQNGVAQPQNAYVKQAIVLIDGGGAGQK